MKLNDYVLILNSYECNKNCPYCIAKMNHSKISSIEEEIKKLKDNIHQFKSEEKQFQSFILSGNGEPSLYPIDTLIEIKDIVESAGIFSSYRVQTSGNLFNEPKLLNLFKNWIKEITVISNDSKIDQEFYGYKKEYLNSKAFLSSKNIRVNIVLLKNNFRNMNEMIAYFDNLKCVDCIALKILDNSNNDSKYSKWITENSIRYEDIDEIIEKVSICCNLVSFHHQKFYFKTKHNKKLTIHYDPTNHYDYINIGEKQKYSWHKKKIEKGIYGQFSKVLEEVQEAEDALEQENHLMHLIELSDIIGAVEGIVTKYGLSLNDLKLFSDKVKESKQYE